VGVSERKRERARSREKRERERLEAVRAGDFAGTQKGLPDAPAIINTEHNPRYD